MTFLPRCPELGRVVTASRVIFKNAARGTLVPLKTCPRLPPPPGEPISSCGPGDDPPARELWEQRPPRGAALWMGRGDDILGELPEWDGRQTRAGGRGGEARGRGVLTLEGAEHGQWGGGRAGMGVCRVFPSPDPAHACPASPGAWHPHLPFLGVLGAPSQGRCDLLSVLLPGTHSPVRPQPERPRWGAGSRESDAAGFSLTCS